MTDIDALIAEALAEMTGVAPTHADVRGSLIFRLLDALTAEREKVAAMEAEVERLQAIIDNWSLAEKLIEADKEIERLRAESTRWREVAGELAGAVEQAQTIFVHCDVTSGCCMCGSPVDGHGWGDGHSAVDQGTYVVDQWIPRADAALAHYAKIKDPAHD